MMGTENLKQEILAQIQKIDDEYFLIEVSEWLKMRTSQDENEVHPLSQREIELLEEASQSVDEGNFTPHDEVKRNSERWLNELD